MNKDAKDTSLQSYHLNCRGLQRVLGTLEAEIMESMWHKQEATIREVWEELCLEKHVAFNTIMTVMNRLVEKGLLRRSGVTGSYRFQPLMTREDFLDKLSREVSLSLITDFGRRAVAQFVEVLEEGNPEYLELIQEMVCRRKEGHNKKR